jgi:glutathione peroxidase-family protein
MIERLTQKAVSLAQRAAFGAPPEGEPDRAAVTLTRLDGSAMAWSELEGRVVLFVNVASRCGLTPQYEELVQLDQALRPRGLTIVGVPCNQFLGQEPGTAEEIATFCATRYGADFPLLEKQDVNGAGRSPLYQWLIAHSGGADIGWNFEKVLVGRDGQVAGRFSPRTAPSAPELRAAIEAALG